MRVGLLADVHANLPALQVALRRLAVEEVDTILVAGDLVGYGASPNACVELLAEAGAVCIAGNHDLFMLDRLPADRFSQNARRAATVTQALLGDDTRTFLAALPTVRRIDSLVMAHGSLDDPEEYVEDRRRIAELLREMVAREPGARTLVLGHTHHQRRVRTISADGSPTSRLLNPGSVGQSRAREPRPRVRLATYDTASGRSRFLRLHYDVETAHRLLLEHGLDPSCLHSPAGLSRRVVGRLPHTVRAQLGHVRRRFIPSAH